MAISFADAARRITGLFDSVSVCFSKGLGAPVGLGSAAASEFIARATALRKDGRGGMRQAGCWRRRGLRWTTMCSLSDDHALCAAPSAWPRAWRASTGPRSCAAQTNIVFVDLAGPRDPAFWNTRRARAQATGLTGCALSRTWTDAAGDDHAVAPFASFPSACDRTRTSTAVRRAGLSIEPHGRTC